MFFLELRLRTLLSSLIKVILRIAVSEQKPKEIKKAFYQPLKFEKKWQKVWQKKGLYKTLDASRKPKYYCLVMFPYSSGDLHIGHWYNFAPADTFARYKRMKGFNVLHPIGFDSFGLPAENAAIKRSIHPRGWTERNVLAMTKQLKTIGASYDWDRVLSTHRPDYYRWTQWLFLLMYKRGLAYKKKAPSNWCPKCESILANEQAEGGVCWRCSGAVEQREVEQWFLRITRYANELLETLKQLDWPEKTRLMQKNWIGKTEGVVIDYPVVGRAKTISCYSTRPETNFGATFVVVAPEHPLVPELTTKEQEAAVGEYLAETRRKTELERIGLEREKTGVFSGRYCLNRLTGKQMPVWIADFVVLTAGTGMVVGVPAHDERDFQFAKKYGLEIVPVVKPEEGEWAFEKEAFTRVEKAVVFNSGLLNGLSPLKAKEGIIKYLVEKGWGRRAVNYHLRDWLVSRQRYWGVPIPIVYCPDCGTVPVPEDSLPVLLPEIEDFRPKEGESPLARSKSFVNISCPQCGKEARRDTDTMDTFVCSSWYYLAYSFWHKFGNQEPRTKSQKFSGKNVFVKYKDLLDFWLPVDRYIGGAEHTVLHLLYSRFFVKVLRDAGLLSFDEPFLSLRHQGIILGEDGQRMSKSRGNVVNPDDLVKKYGADTVRLYLCFLGPFDQGGPWNPRGIKGAHRFLKKVWQLVISACQRKALSSPLKFQRRLHHLIKRVGEDLEAMKFNTAVAEMMKFVNEVTKNGSRITNNDLRVFLRLLAPFAPHLAEELWLLVGDQSRQRWSVHQQSWPAYDEKMLGEVEVEVVIQVNGRRRASLRLPVVTARFDSPASKKEVEGRALALERVRKNTAAGVIKIVFVPGKIINFVTKNAKETS